MNTPKMIEDAFTAARNAVGVDLTYIRDQVVRPLRAVPGRASIESFDGLRPADNFDASAFIFLAADVLAAFGEPVRGDVITRKNVHEVTETYHVSPVADERHFRYSDPFRVLMRVHAVLVEEDALNVN